MINEFKHIEYVEDLGPVIARVNRNTGELKLNRQKYGDLPVYWREFILLHELAHYKLKTADEKAVSEWALKKFVSSGDYSERLAQAVEIKECLDNPDAVKKRHEYYAAHPVMKPADHESDFVQYIVMGLQAASSTIMQIKGQSDAKKAAEKQKEEAERNSLRQYVSQAGQVDMQQQAAERQNKLIIAAIVVVAVLFVLYLIVKNL